MKGAKLLIPILIISSSLVPTYKFYKYQNHYKMHFVDVGQGDSVLIRTPQNCTIVVDGGPPNNLIDTLAKYLPATERKIDLIVLSHPHLDHLGGLIQLFKRYEVKNLFTSGVTYKSSFYKEFNKIAPFTHYVNAGEKYFLCGVEFEILYPQSSVIGKEIDNVNNATVVMRVKIKDKLILLTGDAEKEVEHELAGDLRAHVMKAGHHGSRTSNTLELLQKVQPKYFVIQSGQDNQFDHPHIESILNARAVGAKILRTDKQGTITFVF